MRHSSGRGRLIGGLVASGLVLILTGCGGDRGVVPAREDSAAAGGWITYSVAGGRVYRLRAQKGAKPQNITQALDALSPRGKDSYLNISPDGQWLILHTERFDPAAKGWPCLAVVRANLSQGGAVRNSQGNLVRCEGFSAVASGGNLIIYAHRQGPHQLDLWALRRKAGQWGKPLLLTRYSTFAYNDYPAISANGRKVLFHAGPAPYGQTNTAICEVTTGGYGFRVVAAPPAGRNYRSPDYAPDGSVVFEGDLGDGEYLYRLPKGQTTPVKVAGQLRNDNSPCVLPDGRIVSLWLDRPGGTGHHEIKVMSADGKSYYMALTKADVSDSGLGAGS